MHIRKCPSCGIYTLKETCPKCGAKTLLPKPPKFSPGDKYLRYRIKYKEEQSRGRR